MEHYACIRASWEVLCCCCPLAALMKTTTPAANDAVINIFYSCIRPWHLNTKQQKQWAHTTAEICKRYKCSRVERSSSFADTFVFPNTESFFFSSYHSLSISLRFSLCFRWRPSGCCYRFRISSPFPNKSQMHWHFMPAVFISLFAIRYSADGTIAPFTPVTSGAKQKSYRNVVVLFSYYKLFCFMFKAAEME